MIFEEGQFDKIVEYITKNLIRDKKIFNDIFPIPDESKYCIHENCQKPEHCEERLNSFFKRVEVFDNKKLTTNPDLRSQQYGLYFLVIDYKNQLLYQKIPKLINDIEQITLISSEFIRTNSNNVRIPFGKGFVGYIVDEWLKKLSSKEDITNDSYSLYSLQKDIRQEFAIEDRFQAIDSVLAIPILWEKTDETKNLIGILLLTSFYRNIFSDKNKCLKLEENSKEINEITSLVIPLIRNDSLNSLISKLRLIELSDLQNKSINKFILKCFDFIIKNKILDITCLSFNDDIIIFSSEFTVCEFDKIIELYLEDGGNDHNNIKKLIKIYFGIKDIECYEKKYRKEIYYIYQNLNESKKVDEYNAEIELAHEKKLIDAIEKEFLYSRHFIDRVLGQPDGNDIKFILKKQTAFRCSETPICKEGYEIVRKNEVYMKNFMSKLYDEILRYQSDDEKNSIYNIHEDLKHLSRILFFFEGKHQYENVKAFLYIGDGDNFTKVDNDFLGSLKGTNDITKYNSLLFLISQTEGHENIISYKEKAKDEKNINFLSRWDICDGLKYFRKQEINSDLKRPLDINVYKSRFQKKDLFINIDDIKWKIDFYSSYPKQIRHFDEDLDKMFFEPFKTLIREKILDIKKKEHSLHSAAVTIMVRNFSHHHGSHVIPRLEIIDINKVIKESKSLPDTEFRKNLEEANSQIKEYLFYLQEKAGFFTSIGISRPISAGFININDKLKYLNENEGIRLFLKCFARASDLEADDVYVFEPERIVLEKKDEIIVSLGYGEIGVHALYIIFENFVRNLLKHCRPSNSSEPNPKVKFKVEQDNKFAKITIYTDNYIVKKEDNITDIHKNILKAINESDLIDKNGHADLEFAGIKEMRICANILAGKELSEKGTLQPDIYPDKYNGRTISYSFKVPIAKYVMDSDNVSETFNNIKEGKESKPFFFMAKKEAYSDIKNNWNLMPQKICWIGERLIIDDKAVENWINKRSLLISESEWQDYNKNHDKKEKEKYNFILKKWVKSRKKLPKVEFYNACEKRNDEMKKNQSKWDKIVTELELDINENEKIIFCHQHNSENNRFHIPWTHLAHFGIYRYFFWFNEKENRWDSLFPHEKENIILEIYSVLVTKIVIFDNEIYDRTKDKHDKFEKIGLVIKREEEIENINDFSEYDCEVFHLGKLDVTKKIYDINYDKLPLYVRIVTGRIRPLEKKAINSLWAYSEQIDRSVFFRAFNEEDIFNTKYQIYWVIFS